MKGFSMLKELFTFYIPKLISKAQRPSFLNCHIHKTAKVDSKCALTAVTLGRYTYVGSGTDITDTTVGSFCSIAGGCQIGGGEHPLHTVSTSPAFLRGRNILRKNFSDIAYEAAKPVTIGNDVWIGANAYIRGGVTIGSGAVIGAHAVVTKDVRPYEIVAGCPAKPLRRRFDDETVGKLLALGWWDWTDEKLQEMGKYFTGPEELFHQCE